MSTENFPITDVMLKVFKTQNEFMKTSIFQKSNENVVRISALKVVTAFLWLPGSPQVQEATKIHSEFN